MGLWRWEMGDGESQISDLKWGDFPFQISDGEIPLLKSEILNLAFGI